MFNIENGTITEFLADRKWEVSSKSLLEADHEITRQEQETDSLKYMYLVWDRNRDGIPKQYSQFSQIQHL